MVQEKADQSHSGSGSNKGQSQSPLIDVHHHLCPPVYAETVTRIQPVFRLLLDWSPSKSLDDMDRAGVSTAVLSMTTPGIWFGSDQDARRLARVCNEYAAGLVRDHPGRFGMFAALSLPDVEGSLREIEYALDVLKADGICLFTSYDAHYLGEPMFEPVLAELNRRKAVVYTHPVICPCSINIVPVVSEACIEYGTDTTRTIASLLFSGAAARYPDIRFIFSHAGGTMPFLIGRFLQQARNRPSPEKLPHGVMHQVGRFFYDTAQSCNPAPMAALRHVAATSQILFGTDFPWGNSAEHANKLADCGFTQAELQLIHGDNATALLPRLRGV